MSDQFNIAILLPYYGKLPWYFLFFIKSCGQNPDISFLFFTDQKIHCTLPPNIKVYDMSFEALKNLASEKLGFPVAVDAPYKLCDLRPAFGIIFSEYITGFHFWGHGDIDVIYGNIRQFMNNETLANFDIISVRAEYVSGFFCLYRNTPAICNMYKESKDFKKIFQDTKYYCFDECNHNHDALWRGKSIFQVKAEVQCMTYTTKKLQLCKSIRAHFGTIAAEGTPGFLHWNNGQLIFKNKYPFLLYHLIEYKNLSGSIIPKWKFIPDKFYINSFYFSKHAPGSLPGMLSTIYFKVRRKISRIGKKLPALRSISLHKSVS